MLSIRKVKHLIYAARSASNFMLHNNYISMQFDQVKQQKFPYFWLRDHCRCSKCYEKSTQQIMFNLVNLPLDIRPKCAKINGEKLKITWAFDNHESEYSFDWLKSITFDPKPKSKKVVVFWNKDDVNSFHDIKVDYKRFNQKEDGVKALLKAIIKYGFGIVTNVDTNLEATEKVVKEIAMVKPTLFGDMWEVTNDAAHSDTAYTQIGLLPHNDNTYFSDASGLQVFHMLSHDGEGGETLLVDGFNGCNRLKQKYEPAFKILSTIPVTARYLEEGYHYSTSDTVIKLHPTTGELYQIRFNIFDREVLQDIAYEDVMDFYKSYILLGKELFSEEAVLKIKLEPGNVIFIDNWRVLHGRQSYTGLRTLCGCYVSRDDWTSKAQSLKLNVY